MQAKITFLTIFINWIEPGIPEAITTHLLQSSIPQIQLGE